MKKKNINDERLLKSGFSLGVDTDIFDPTGKDFITGDSIEEHRMIERANEYLGEDEIRQQNNNL